MKLFFKSKDGGKESTVTGYFLIESKSFFSIVLLKFEGKSREAYHTHAFNCLSWVLKGNLIERFRRNNYYIRTYSAKLIPFKTYKHDYHKVDSIGTSWVLSFRGKWDKEWMEYTKEAGDYTLTNGRIKKTYE